MEALEARHLTSHSRTQVAGRVTVYVETSVESVKSWEVITCRQPAADQSHRGDRSWCLAPLTAGTDGIVVVLRLVARRD